jgi:transposase
MPRGRPKAPLVVSDQQRATLESWSRRTTSANGLAQRARMVLASAEGLSNQEVARRVGVTGQTVGKWRRRFIERGVAGLFDEPRPGAPRSVSDADIERVIVATLESAPPGATHWSTRSMAAHTGLSATTIRRVWAAFGLQPHRTETWKLSADPQFIEKVRDVVGLYLDPPERALVLCVDEKSQIQALDRSAPVLPMLPGTPERASHDYLRHGTTSLFAALDVGSGRVYGQLRRRHRAKEFGAFLRHLDAEVPADLDVHLILDNYATHKTPAIRRWLAAHPRFVLHFTPTSASWLNLVERWFSELTTKKLRRSAHRSTRALERDIREWMERWNAAPRPFVWTKKAFQND